MRKIFLVLLLCYVSSLSACVAVEKDNPEESISEALSQIDSVYCFGVTTDGERIFNIERLWLLGEEYLQEIVVPAGNRTTTKFLVNKEFYSGMTTNDLKYPLQRQYTWNDLELPWQDNSLVQIDGEVVCTRNEGGAKEFQCESSDVTVIYRLLNQRIVSIGYWGSIPVTNTTEGKTTEKELKKTYYFIYLSEDEIRAILNEAYLYATAVQE